jgi:hypothetical protein
MQTHFPKAAAAAVVLCLAPFAASATTTTVQAGDIDCFGGADDSACLAGAFPSIPGAFDNASAGDPAGTDKFDTHGTVALGFGALSLGGEDFVSAQIEVRVAGIDIYIEPSGGGDANVGASFVLNSALIGTFHEPVVIGSDINQRAITTLTFSIDQAALDFGGGANILTITPESDFGLLPFEAYAVDYATLTIETELAPTVPLPASAWLLGAALAGIGGVGARRRHTATPH